MVTVACTSALVVDDTVPDPGEPVFEGLQAGGWAPGSVVLAPAPDAAISFDSNRTVAAVLLGERRAAMLWQLFKAAGWLLLAAQVIGTLLGACMLFDVQAATWLAQRHPWATLYQRCGPCCMCCARAASP